MNRATLSRQLLAAAALVVLTSCTDTTGDSPVDSAREPNDSLDAIEQEEICGTDDRVFVNDYNGQLGVSTAFVRSLQASAVRVRTPSGVCTGTLIDKNLVLTNSHCVTTTNPAGYSIDVNFEQLAGSTLIRSDWRTVGIAAIMENGNSGYDYAILQTSWNIGADQGWAAIGQRASFNDTRVTLIGHPSGQPKMVSVGEANPNPWNATQIYHDADTLGGSSGSAIFDDSGRIVGLHHTGGCGIPLVWNIGTEMDDLRPASPLLSSLYRRQGLLEQDPDRYSLFAIKKAGAATTEVHVLRWGSDFRAFRQQVTTPLYPTGSDGSWDFSLGDYNEDGRPDIYAINKVGTSSTEVHILDGATNFSTFLLQTNTTLHPTGSDGSWDFSVDDYNGDGRPDLYAVNKVGTASTEVHILDGATNFSTFLLQTNTTLYPTGSTRAWDFSIDDYNGDGSPDIYAINKVGTSSTEVHILDGATNFSTFLLQTNTTLYPTGSDESWNFGLGDYNEDGRPDIYAVNKVGTASTEVHILNGATNFSTFLLQANSALHPTGVDGSWQFFAN